MSADAGRVQDTRFKSVQSGNPAGKAKGTRHRATRAVEALLDGDAEKLTRKAIEMALAGDTAAMRLCLDRLAPPRRDRPVPFTFPKLDTVADAKTAAAAVLEAVAEGELTPGEAADLSKLLSDFTRVVEVADLERRLVVLEQARPR